MRGCGLCDCAGTLNVLFYCMQGLRSLSQDAQHSILLLFLLLFTIVFLKNKIKNGSECKDDDAVMMKLVKSRSFPFSWDAYEDAPEGDIITI